MVRVEDDRHIVMLGHQTDMLGAGNGAQDGSLLVGVLDTLACKNTNVRYKNNKGRGYWNPKFYNC